MSPERAFNIVLDAAVLPWAANTKQGELREALALLWQIYSRCFSSLIQDRQYGHR